MKIFVLLLVLSALSTVLCGFLSSPFKTLKEKAKEVYKKNFKKDKTWHFLGFDNTEYPGTNSEYRKIQAEKWDRYYNCLNSQSTSFKSKMGAVPEALLAFQGSFIRYNTSHID